MPFVKSSGISILSGFVGASLKRSSSMLPLSLAPEPPDFNAEVRQPGLLAINEMLGHPVPTRTGPPRTQYPSLSKIPLRRFPDTWTKAIPWLREAYRCICAYSCLYIELITGTKTVDHFHPKSLRRDLIYEWSNYRLASHSMNRQKGNQTSILDPFNLQEGMFALDLVNMKVLPGPHAGAALAQVEATIQALKLDGPEYKAALNDYFDKYWRGQISMSFLDERAPFLAHELRRQRWPTPPQPLNQPLQSFLD